MCAGSRVATAKAMRMMVSAANATMGVSVRLQTGNMLVIASKERVVRAAYGENASPRWPTALPELPVPKSCKMTTPTV